MAWFDRTGRLMETLGPKGNYGNVAIDHGGRRVLFDRLQPRDGTRNLWILDPEHNGEVRVTSDPTDEYNGIWLPDGKSIVYTARSGGMCQLRRRELSTGRVEALTPFVDYVEAGAVVTGTSQLAYTNETGGRAEMRLVSLLGDKKSDLLPQAEAFGRGGIQLSPEGRFMVFADSESGQDEIYVAPLSSPEEKIRVSFGVGSTASSRWSRDGREILYLSPGRQLMSAPIRTTPSLSVGKPSALFTFKEDAAAYFFDVSPDGKRFLAVLAEGAGEPAPLHIVLNWTAEVAAAGGQAR